MNTNKTTQQTIALLSTAITAALSGDDLTATKNTAEALRILTGGTVKAVATTTTKAVTKTAKVAKKAARKGAKPLLNASQAAMLASRVAAGETIASVAKSYRISYPTASRYIKMARSASQVKQEVNN